MENTRSKYSSSTRNYYCHCSNFLIASSTHASSINKKSTVNPEIIRFTPNALQLFLGEIKKKKKNPTITHRSPYKSNKTKSKSIHVRPGYPPNVRPAFTFKGENYDYPSRRGGGDGSGLNLLRNFARAPMSISVLTIFALPNIFLALRSPGPSTATFSFPGGGTFIKTPVNSAVRRSREAPTTGRGLRFIQCYTARLRGQA